MWFCTLLVIVVCLGAVFTLYLVCVQTIFNSEYVAESIFWETAVHSVYRTFSMCELSVCNFSYFIFLFRPDFDADCTSSSSLLIFYTSVGCVLWANSEAEGVFEYPLNRFKPPPICNY